MKIRSRRSCIQPLHAGDVYFSDDTMCPNCNVYGEVFRYTGKYGCLNIEAYRILVSMVRCPQCDSDFPAARLLAPKGR